MENDPADEMYLLGYVPPLRATMGNNINCSIRVGTRDWFNFPVNFTRKIAIQ